jgi:hypothetical protein
MLALFIRKLMMFGGFLLAVMLGWSATAGEAVNVDGENLAIKGYDPVAYFTESRPTRGLADFEHVWQDARWQFANAEHLALFAQDPEAYAPQYGGFCAGAMALGWKAPIDPEAWTIVDGRLFLNYSKGGRDNFAEDPEPEIAEADQNWEVLGTKD